MVINNPKLWDIENPWLYKLVTVVKAKEFLIVRRQMSVSGQSVLMLTKDFS